jgi:DNA-binding NarL/FixJ family response regulator
MASRVLIVDDNTPFLDAARSLLELGGLDVAGVASTSAEALRGVEQLRPDAVLVDISLAGESGLDLARSLAARDGGRSPVILMSTHAESDFADLIAESPASGFVSKVELSADAIRRILESDDDLRPDVDDVIVG